MEKTRKSKRKQSSGKNLTVEVSQKTIRLVTEKLKAVIVSRRRNGKKSKTSRQRRQTLRENKENSTHHNVVYQGRKIMLLNKFKYRNSPIDILYM